MAHLMDRLASHRATSTSVPLVAPRKCGHAAVARSASAIGTSQRVRWQPSTVCLASADASRSSNGDAASKPEDYIVACKPCLDEGLETAILKEADIKTKFIAETILPTKFGKFRLRGYKHSIDGGVTFTEPAAIISGQIEGKENVPVRVHDACFTSEVLGSLKCDCADQLALALQMIHDQQEGMVIYLQQEGRGIGLANKIAAYSLQEQGLDTVDANRALGLPDDCREYTSVRNILRDLGIKSIRLITNNPRKMNVLTSLGIPVSGRVPCVVEGGEYSKGYLATKMKRMDHLLGDGDGWAAEPGARCFWDHEGEPAAATPVSTAVGGMDRPNGAAVNSKGRVLVDMSAAPVQSKE